LIFIFGYKIVKKSKRVIPATADLTTGKDRVGKSVFNPELMKLDREEEEHILLELGNPKQNKVLILCNLMLMISAVVSTHCMVILEHKSRRIQNSCAFISCTSFVRVQLKYWYIGITFHRISDHSSGVTFHKVTPHSRFL
jgi:hypothetical protein